MPALIRRPLPLDSDDEDEFDIHTTYIGPGGSSGQGILKPETNRPVTVTQPHRLQALNIGTIRDRSPVPVRQPLGSPVITTPPPVYTAGGKFQTPSNKPKMDYYSSRATYGHGGDDFLPSSTRSRALVSSTLDDNDLISRRSRLADARILGNMTQTMNALNAVVPPRPIIRPVHVRKPVQHPQQHRPVVIVPAASQAVRVTSRRDAGYIYPLTVPAPRHHARTINHHPVIYEVGRDRIEPLDLPRVAESLGALKRHVVDIKAGMGNQRMLLDRYLPIEMGPTRTVDQGINKKYYELAVRMPNLEPDTYRKRSYLQDECAIRPVTPRALRSQSVPRQVGSSAVPMSETRKNIRKLISKTRRDPSFYE